MRERERESVRERERRKRNAYHTVIDGTRLVSGANVYKAELRGARGEGIPPPQKKREEKNYCELPYLVKQKIQSNGLNAPSGKKVCIVPYSDKQYGFCSVSLSLTLSLSASFNRNIVCFLSLRIRLLILWLWLHRRNVHKNKYTSFGFSFRRCVENVDRVARDLGQFEVKIGTTFGRLEFQW